MEIRTMYTIKLLCCVLIGITTCSPLVAQVDTTQVYLLGGIYSEEGSKLLRSADGGFLLLGTSGSIQSELTDIYVLKLNNELECMWNVQLGGVGVDHGSGISENADGEIVVCGFSASVDGTGYNISAFKLSADGALIWTKSYGGDNWDFGNGVVIHPTGGYIIYGQTYSFGNGNGDGYVLQIDEEGSLIQTWTFGGSGEDNILDVDIEENRIYFSGYQTQGEDDVPYRSITATDYTGAIVWNSILETPGGESSYSNSIIVDDLIYAVANSQSENGYRQGMIVAIHKSDGSLFYNNFEEHNGDFVFNDLSFVQDQIIITGFTNAYGDGNDNGLIAVKDIFGNYVNSITIGAESLKFNSQVINNDKLYVGVEALHVLSDPSFQAAILVYPDLTFEPNSETEWHNLGCFTVDIPEEEQSSFEPKYIKIFDVTGRCIREMNVNDESYHDALSSNMIYLKVYYDVWNRAVRSELMGKY